MFPNVRLLIGALFITILVLSCEFGVFAALRVSREPLSRLTSESAPLQLVPGKNAPPAVPVAWTVPRNAQAPTDDGPTGIATAASPGAQRAERALEATPPSNQDADSARNNDHQASAPLLQTALAPSPAAPPPAADAAPPIAHPPLPPQPYAPPPANEAAPGNSHASGAETQEGVGPAIGARTGNAAPEQAAAAPPALAAAPVQQTETAEILKPAAAQPAEAQPAHPDLASQAHDTAAHASEPPARSAPVLAAIAPAAAELEGTQPAEITGSVSNAAIPDAPPPQAKAPHAGPVPKIVHKRAIKKPPHKVARAPAPSHQAIKKRIARRAHAPRAASSTQQGDSFENPVFQSAPGSQRQARSRAGARNNATNNSFGNTFGGQFSAQ